MTNPQKTQEDENWTRLWNARVAALSQIFGKPADSVYHPDVPFQFREHGGAADVVAFPNHIPGTVFVTAEMTGRDVGQIPASLGNYELAICTKKFLPGAAEIISRLAAYTCEAVLNPGETMSLGNILKNSAITALLFTTFGDAMKTFSFNDKRYGILLCIGITSNELKFVMENGSEKLLNLLKKNKIFPYTLFDRSSIPTAINNVV